VTELRGSLVQLELHADTVTAPIQIALLTDRRLGQLDVFVLTNFAVGPRLIDMLATHERVSVRIVGPEALVERLDVPEDQFSLGNFQQARAAAEKACRQGG